MSISKTDICNLALNHLAMKSLVNIDTETTPSATACNLYYEPVRDDTFREFRWPFATVRAALVLTTDEVLGWTYIYLYPVKAVTIWSVFDESTVDDKDTQEYEVIFIPGTNRRVICTQKETAYAEYTYKVEDTTIYDAKFAQAIGYKLAAMLAHQLTGSAELGLKLLEAYQGIVGEAKRISYSERLKKPVQTSSYQNSRG